MRRKISQEELAKVERLIITEFSLLCHAEDCMRELMSFRSLKQILVCCAEGWPQRRGAKFGLLWIGVFVERNQGPGIEHWPTLSCLSSQGTKRECSSRHW